MDYRKQKMFFKKAYDLGEKRVGAGYGWPLEIDPQLLRFFVYIKKAVPEGIALDLGCGQGRHAVFFAEHGFESYGVDYIKRAIDEAKQYAKVKNLKKAHFKIMDIFKLNFPSNYFDVIIDWSVLDHIYPTQRKLYLKNILKVLKVGGFSILTEFSANDRRIKDKSKNYAWDRNSYDHYFTEDELRDLFSKNFEFLKIVETKLGTSPPHLMINLLLKRVA